MQKRIPSASPKSCCAEFSLLRYAEIRWFYQHGASEIFPDAWEAYRDAIPLDERDDFLSAYHKRLTGTDQRAALAAARAWSMWEASASFLYSNVDNIKKWGEDQFALAVARIECHYFVNRGFLRSESQLIDDVPRIRHIPATIVQGRYDVVCPATSAWDLHRAWPEAELRHGAGRRPFGVRTRQYPRAGARDRSLSQPLGADIDATQRLGCACRGSSASSLR